MKAGVLSGVLRLDFLLTPALFVVLLGALGFLAGDRPLDDSSKPRPWASVTQRGSGVRSLAFSPDGRTLASVAGIEGLATWDLPVMERRSPTLPNLQSRALAFDGQRLAVASNDNQSILVLDESTGSVQATLTCGPEPLAFIGLAFGPDATLLGGSTEGVIRIWDLESKQLKREIYPPSPLLALAISADGQVVVAGGDRGRISVWEVATGRPIAQWAGPEPCNVLALAILPEGRRLISAGDDRAVRAWDLKTGRPLAPMIGHQAGIDTVAVSPDSQTIASGDRLGQLRLWDAASGESLASIKGHTLQAGALAFSPDGQTIASGGYDNKIHLWDVAKLIDPGPGDIAD